MKLYKLFISFMLITLVGCGSPQPIVQTKYIVRTASDEMKTLPPLPIEVKSEFMSNTQAALSISQTEEYVVNLENMIQTLVNFYEKPVNVDEAKSFQVVTPRDTAVINTQRLITPQK